MILEEFNVSEYRGETPTATVKPTMTPYPTLKLTPTSTPLPECETPRPTIVSAVQEDAKSKNVYKFSDDFDFYEKNIGETPVMSGKKDSEYPFYVWNIYEGGTWEKINGFGVKNINGGEQITNIINFFKIESSVNGVLFMIYFNAHILSMKSQFNVSALILLKE